MFNQYLIIVIATIIRFAGDTFFTVNVIFNETLISQTCLIDTEARLEVWRYVILILSCLLTHYLPILIILRIYTIEDRHEDMSKSLLIASEEKRI